MLLALGVGITGAIGAGARHLIAEAVARWSKASHRATLLINFSGTFALGVATSALAGAGQAPMRLLLGAGFLGGYTTFSALSFETATLARRGELREAWLNVGLSLAGGLVAAWLGLAVGLAL